MCVCVSVREGGFFFKFLHLLVSHQACMKAPEKILFQVPSFIVLRQAYMKAPDSRLSIISPLGQTQNHSSNAWYCLAIICASLFYPAISSLENSAIPACDIRDGPQVNMWSEMPCHRTTNGSVCALPFSTVKYSWY